MDLQFRHGLASLAGLKLDVSFLDMPRSVWTPWKDLGVVLALVRVLRGWGPDIVHGHSSKGGAYARLSAWLIGKPSAYTPNAFVFATGVTGIADQLYRAIERALGRITTLLICVSESESDIADRELIRPLLKRLIPNGVEVAGAPSTRAKQTPRTRVLSIGRLSEQKDPVLWAKIVKEATRVRPGTFTFQWAGDGHLLATVRRELRGIGPEDAVLLGHRSDVPELLESAEIVLMTSQYEGLPYALLESMAAGKPCIARACPGVSELFVDGETGILVRSDDESAYVRELESLADDVAKRDRMGVAARHRVSLRYSLEAMTRATEHAYIEAMALWLARPRSS
jgi:glycosyltransferase involved in cell wall biosynthesis